MSTGSIKETAKGSSQTRSRTLMQEKKDKRYRSQVLKKIKKRERERERQRWRDRDWVRERDRERQSRRFFASDLIKVNKQTKNTFLEDFTMKDAMKLNKQDPLVQNVIVPVLPIVIQNNGQVEKEKEKEK